MGPKNEAGKNGKRQTPRRRGLWLLPPNSVQLILVTDVFVFLLSFWVSVWFVCLFVCLFSESMQLPSFQASNPIFALVLLLSFRLISLGRLHFQLHCSSLVKDPNMWLDQKSLLFQFCRFTSFWLVLGWFATSFFYRVWNTFAKVKMLEKAKDLPPVKDMLEKSKPILGYDILDICLNGPEEKLEETRYCQPAMFIGGLAGLEKLREERSEAVDRASVMAGLSLGAVTWVTQTCYSKACWLYHIDMMSFTFLHGLGKECTLLNAWSSCYF